MLPLVALVGRPNVGKSTLFNALTRSRDALVHDEPGVTRDRHYGVCRLDPDRPFLLVDTGGIAGEEEGLAGATARQARAAAAEADLILFVVDGREGTSALDDEILAWLRKLARPTLLVVNKIDGTFEEAVRGEFARYGFADMLAVSAAHRQGLDDLHAEVLERLPEEGSGEELDNDPNRLRIAFVGRPNVGKSTLVNRLLGEERMIASEVPGTTRDSIAADLERDGKLYRLIDTAGIRRRGKVEEAVEKFSVVKTMQAIERCQVAVLMLDATEGVTDQDATVLGAVLDAGRALVIAVNKWDAVEDRAMALRQVEDKLQAALAQVKGVPVVTISALLGRKLDTLLDAVLETYAQWNRRIPTAQLNRWIEGVLEHHPPPLVEGRRVKIRYVTQVKTRPPTFALFVNKPLDLPESYQRYLIGHLRDSFELPGVPVRLLLRKGRNPYAES